MPTTNTWSSATAAIPWRNCRMPTVTMMIAAPIDVPCAQPCFVDVGSDMTVPPIKVIDPVRGRSPDPTIVGHGTPNRLLSALFGVRVASSVPSEPRQHSRPDQLCQGRCRCVLRGQLELEWRPVTADGGPVDRDVGVEGVQVPVQARRVLDG